MTSLPIAKCYGEGGDQIVFLRVNDEESGDPAVRIMFDPQMEPLAVVQSTVTYDTVGQRDAAFEQVDEQYAIQHCEHFKEQLRAMMGSK